MPDRSKRLLRLLDGLTVHAVTEEMKQLSERYVQAGVFTAIMMNDSVHVAAAVLPSRHIIVLEFQASSESRSTREDQSSECFSGTPDHRNHSSTRDLTETVMKYFDFTVRSA